MLEEAGNGLSAQIKGFERLANGKFGPVQKHGGVLQFVDAHRAEYGYRSQPYQKLGKGTRFS